MNVATLQSKSLWVDVAGRRYPKLQKNVEYDVAVVGGGITGLTAAYLLKQAGQKVAVLDKGVVGGAETGHTTAHLAMVTDARLGTLAKNFGKDAARATWQAGLAAIDTIEQIVRRHDIDCSFQRVPGFLHAALMKDRHEHDELREEAALAVELGFEAEYRDAVPVVQRPGIRFANQALFHPLRYIRDLARAVAGDGCDIYGRSEITEFKSDPLRLRVNGHTVRSEKVIVATHVPLVGVEGLLSATLMQTKIAGYSTYAIAARTPRDSLAAASYWDTDDPYFYLRVNLRARDALLIFGGMDHKTGQHDDPEARYVALEELLHELFPQAIVTKRWSGQVIETDDGLPFIGPENERQFIATGFAGNGLTFGTLAGMMACDWVLGRGNPWQELFAVERKPLRAGAWEYLKENADYPYHLIKGFISGTAGDSVEDVPRGEGRVIKIDGQRCAVYRDAEGSVTACSAICTHMGCVVRWNQAEQTWDCPCHGSRFNTQGNVMAGPAETALKRIDPPS
jgi:glycine/D-amino acid oxidase-like deaminating enzyme/nitrite reductase/ring-hydroxylating ferredoxin subunit